MCGFAKGLKKTDFLYGSDRILLLYSKGASEFAFIKKSNLDLWKWLDYSSYPL